MPTLLSALDAKVQARLINRGHAACEAGMRRHVEPDAMQPPSLPQPTGIG